MRMIFDLVEPFVQTFEGVFVCDVENKKNPYGALVVRPGDGFKRFLSGLA